MEAVDFVFLFAMFPSPVVVLHPTLQTNLVKNHCHYLKHTKCRLIFQSSRVRRMPEVTTLNLNKSAPANIRTPVIPSKMRIL